MTDADEVRADLNALIREAHGATKDLKQAAKDLDERIAKAQQLAGDFDTTLVEFDRKIREVTSLVVGEVVDEAVAPVVEQFLADLSAHIELIQAAIYLRFESITEELTEGKGKEAWDNQTLPEYLLSSNFRRRSQA